MIVILSPAKNMKSIKQDREFTLPCFIEHTKQLIKQLETMSEEELQTMMKINHKIAQQNKDRYTDFRYDTKGMPAILAYDGIQYKNIEANDFDEKDQVYATEHIRILSGLYGVLKPYDSIREYRLEMQARIQVGAYKNLYAYWNQCLYEEIRKTSKVIVNMASSEYSKTIENYLDMTDTYLTCTFKVSKKGDLKVESTASKKARGQMVRYMVKNKIEDIENLKQFNVDGYVFKEGLSTKKNYIFVKE